MGLSTHVLDTAAGRPATGVPLRLSVLEGNVWQPVGSGETDADGRCRTLLGESTLQAATYCLRFDTSSYFHRQNLTGLYPWVEIVFTVREPAAHYHIPLLLAANGYSTYRGS